MDSSIISPDPVATASSSTSTTSKEEVTPQYDSSEEWEIGLGNLIIDLDADLEKDRQDVPSADSSPMRIGKMKIKRKVSSSKGDVASSTSPVGVGTLSPRKDPTAATSEEVTLSVASTSSLTAQHPSPERPISKQDMVAKPRVVIHHKKDLGAKQEKIYSNSTMNNASKGPVTVSLMSANQPINPNVLLNTSIALPTTTALQQQLPKPMDNLNHVIAHGVPLGSVNPVKVPGVTAAKLVEGKDLEKKSDKQDEVGVKEEPKKKDDKDPKSETNNKKESSHSGSCAAKKHGGKRSKNEKASTHSIAVDTSDMATLTDPDCLGPCEPGTSVNLEGIVWHETDQGVLVVNVTWRNKTYVGTLLDFTKHDWAPPRFCDSPTSDMESRHQKAPGRPKRGRNSSSTTNSDLSNFTETRSSIHSKLRNSTTIKGRRGSGASNGSRTPPNAVDRSQGKRKVRPTDIDLSSGEDSSKATKRMKMARNTPTPNSSEGAISPVFIECPEPNCNKKYKHINGLRYHQTHAHQDVSRQQPVTPDESDNPDSIKSEENSDINPMMKGDKNRLTMEASEQDVLSSASCSPTKLVGNASEKCKEVKPGHAITPEKRDESVRPPCLPVRSASTDTCKEPNTKDLTKGRLDVARSPKGAQHKGAGDKPSPTKILHGANKTKDASNAVKIKTESHSGEKLNKHKKPLASQGPLSSNQKDMSVFDFNSATEADDRSKKTSGSPVEKQAGVSVIRSNPEQITVKSEPLSPPAVNIPKVPDIPKMPSTMSCDDAQKHVKSKDKTKSGSDKKKVKQDKIVQKPKSARPIAPAPPIPQLQPPQLIAIPTLVSTSNSTAPTTLAIPPPVLPKPTVSSSGVALKPIQPKPTYTDNSTVSATLRTLTDKKPRPKKKSKLDKEKCAAIQTPKDGTKVDSKVVKDNSVKQKEWKHKENPLPMGTRPDQLNELSSVAAAALENNILKQALTASGIGPEDAGRNSPYVTSSSSTTEIHSKTTVSEQPPKDTLKEVPSLLPSRPTANSTIPEMPKLIPTSSILNSANRPLQHGASQCQQQQPQPQSQPPPPPPTKPILPPSHEGHKPDYQSLPLTSSQSKPITTTLPLLELPVACLTAPRGADDSRAGSPAYSDISDANDDPPVVSTKSQPEGDPYAFHDAPVGRTPQSAMKQTDEDLQRVEPLAVPMFSPLMEAARERGISTESLTKSLEPLRVTPVQSLKSESTARELTKEGPEPKKARKDTPSPSGESAYKPQQQQQPPPPVYGGQYPLLHGYMAMDPSYQRLVPTDPQHRQQQEQFIKEQQKRVETERLERERREQEVGKDTNTECFESGERSIPKIKTEPVTPTKRELAEMNKLVRLDRDISKRKGDQDPVPAAEVICGKQLDFGKQESASPDVNATSSVCGSKLEGSRSLQEQQREEMRLYTLYDHKQRELQHQEDEQRKVKVQQEERRRSGLSDSRRQSTDDHHHHDHDNSRRASISPRRTGSSRESGSTSVRKPLGDDKKHRNSPAPGKSQSPSDKGPPRGLIPPSRRVLETYPTYLQPPYLQVPFGPMPFDPNHPYQAINPVVAYPTYIPHELHYPVQPGPRVISPMWKSTEERGHFEHDREQSGGADSPHGSSSRESSRERPTKALDVLQQHANQYFSSHKNERSRSPDAEKERRPSSSPHQAASPTPADRKTPVTPTSSRGEDSPRYDSSRRHGAAVTPGHLLHQHMHTHQHTHLGMGYPVLQPYDPYVLASHQQAAAAAAATANPYGVHRE